MRKFLFVALYPVGIDPRVENVAPLLCVEVDAVRMVGIWGMGGVGKTSLSKAIYNKFFDDFEGKSFISDIRETCKQSGGRLQLIKKLVSDTVVGSNKEITNTDSGIHIIRERLRQRKVLVILDNVDHWKQVEDITASRNCFGSGSRIIITSRDKRLLEKLRVDAIYKAEVMNREESLELFSWHAFGSSKPTKDYMDLSSSVIDYCGGLPLALEVLGSYLDSMSMPDWESALEKLKEVPHNDILKILRISYDGLNDRTERDIFLDISFFFINMDENYVTQILDGCGFFAKAGIGTLIKRCLLSVDEEKKLRMHDLLRDMGREIVCEENYKFPGKRSRLRLYDGTSYILAKQKGTEAVEGLTLKLPKSSNGRFNTIAFKEMERLRLLQLEHVQLTGDYKHLSEELRWLCWHGFPLEFMPDNFYPRHLVAIDLQHSNLRRVWRTKELLFEKLKFLNLSHSHFLTQTPDFAKLPNLRELVLKYCTTLFEVHESIGDLGNLVLVNFEGCKTLKTLPRCLYLKKSVNTLIISGCSKIDTLPEEFGEMEALTTFLADDTAITQVPPTITKLKKLLYLSCCGYTGLPTPLFNSIFWSQISPRGSPSSVSLLPDFLRGLNSITELCLRGFALSNDGILKALLMLRSLGFSKLQTLTMDHSTKSQSILGFDKLLDFAAIILREGWNNINNTSKQSIFQICTLSGSGGGFGTFVRGNDISDCFMYGEGSPFCFEVPRSIDRDLEGFIVRIVYSTCVDKTVAADLPSMIIINLTKNIIQIKQPVTVDEVIFHEHHIWEGNVSQSSFNLENGDKVKVVVDFGPRIIVQKIGVDLVHGRMIEYHSTLNKDAIIVNDNEDASKDQVAINFKRSYSNDNTESSHSGFCDGREAKRQKCDNDTDDRAESSNSRF